jgi:iron(III) transport system ATP-binding protein
MADLALEAVAKRFGDLVVLDGLDLRVADGTTLAIVGPSGCGKTTILRLIAGFEEPDAGTIAIGGTMVAGPAWVPAHRRGIGYVPQDGGLFPHLSVGDNVMYGLRGSDRREARLGELLDLVSLDQALATRRPDELSGGQQQRVALARALAIEPRLMLLDEPFSALDADLRAETRHAVRHVLDRTGTTAIVVTHDPVDAHDFATVVAVMAEGRIARSGAPADIYDVGERGLG